MITSYLRFGDKCNVLDNELRIYFFRVNLRKLTHNLILSIFNKLALAFSYLKTIKKEEEKLASNTTMI